MTDAKRVFNRRLSFAGLNGVRAQARRPRVFFWLVTILLLLCPLISRAQELAATLSGTVTDRSGAVIPNATITITQNGVNGVPASYNPMRTATTSLPISPPEPTA